MGAIVVLPAIGNLPIYCEEADMIQRFGDELLSQYSSMTGSDTNEQVSARRLWGRYQGSRDIDLALRGGQYTVPFTAPFDSEVIDICAYLSLIRLYELKGTMDWNPDSGKPQHRYHFQRTEAAKKLNAIRTGRLKLAISVKYKTALGVHNARVATGALEGKENDWGFVDPQFTPTDEQQTFPDDSTS